eukprot:TRINITY_DN279_c0_g1_i12.p1 TRINITY_DN279_c0_g1~~TRINITY_DN279_c0_g1_i12.p1  ORF type:complete len:513 (-),score=67.01 TRINITY_DN279_c0_g1_i12:208-1746(-)
MEIADVLFWVCAGAVALIGAVCVRIAIVQWWTPLQLKRCFNSQGIKGTPYKFFFGNALDVSRMLSEAQSAPPIFPVSHDIFHRVSPHFHTWSQLYGKEFVFWFGNKARLYVQKPEHIKEILADKSGRLSLRVPNANPLARNLVSRGLVGLQGQKWALHRKLLNPAFHLDRLKGMIPAIRESCRLKLEEWSRAVNEGAAELDMLKEFQMLTGDVIARTAFGSSFRQGKHIFDLQSEQMTLSIKLSRTIYIPGFRFLPTETNRKCWKIENEIRKSLKVLIASREKSENLGDDLLGLMLSASKNNQEQLSIEEIVDECKTFYFAGHETTAVLLSWVMILLGMHEEWQIQARNEVLHVIGKDNYPTADTIGRLNTVGMIINEALRLYPPGVFIMRETSEAAMLGNLFLPKGTQLVLPILALHHDPSLWGDDANHFNPSRFSHGIANACKYPNAFMPFGFGPRICIGQNFALLEAKLILAMILQRFSFVLSPSYSHAPAQFLALRPQHGAQVILHNI